MMFSCIQGHDHETAAGRDGCDAHTRDVMSLLKLAKVGFTGPAKIGRVYRPGRSEFRSGLEVVIFSEEQIVPWGIRDDEPAPER